MAAAAAPASEAAYVTPALVNHPRYSQLQRLKSCVHSSVVLAEDQLSGGLVALKLLERKQVGIDGFGEQEVMNAMSLHHPHIVPLKEVFLTDDHLVLVLDYAAGGSLAGIIPPARGVPEEEARWLFQQIMFALEYVHRMGLASRAVTLENVWLDPTGTRPIVRLAEFGLCTTAPWVARPQPCDQAMDKVFERLGGAPTYSAPEVLASSESALYDPKAADIWACGVLLFVMACGTFPFQQAGDSGLEQSKRLQAVAERIASVEYTIPSKLSEPLRDLLSRMLTADPKQRPTAADVLQHPWCCEGLHPSALLDCNTQYVSTSRRHPPAPEVVDEVRGILLEATLGIDTPANDVQRMARNYTREDSMPSVRNSLVEGDMATTTSGLQTCEE